MTDYLDFKDLKATIIGIIVFFICLGIQRYWSNHTVKSLNRRIRHTEEHKLLVEDLAKSERAVLLFGFQTVFALFFAMALISAASQIVLLSFVVAGWDLDRWSLVLALMWGLLAIVSFYAAQLIKKVHDYPESLEIFEKKIERFRNKLRGGITIR